MSEDKLKDKEKDEPEDENDSCCCCCNNDCAQKSTCGEGEENKDEE